MYDKTAIAQAFSGLNLPADQYVKDGAAAIVSMLQSKPELWRSFGGYYPGVQAIVLEYLPDFAAAREWNGGEPPPDYLEGYDYGDDALNLFAALAYLTEGDMVRSPDDWHSIVMPDGSNASYMPGVGIHDD